MDLKFPAQITKSQPSFELISECDSNEFERIPYEPVVARFPRRFPQQNQIRSKRQVTAYNATTNDNFVTDEKESSPVCIDALGEIIEDQSSWIHQSPNGKCAKCSCNVSDCTICLFATIHGLRWLIHRPL